MKKVKVEVSLQLAERILMLNKKNSKLLTTLIGELETNQSINKISKKCKNSI